MNERPAGVARIVFGRVVRNRCPQCGGGRICPTRLSMAERCDACGLVYRREQGAMTGSMYLSSVVTQVFAAALLFPVMFLTDWSLGTSLLVTLAAVGAFCLWFVRPSRTLWTGVEYWNDLREGSVHLRPGPQGPR